MLNRCVALLATAQLIIRAVKIKSVYLEQRLHLHPRQAITVVIISTQQDTHFQVSNDSVHGFCKTVIGQTFQQTSRTEKEVESSGEEGGQRDTIKETEWDDERRL